MMNTLKTAALSLGLVCAGSGAFAATIANLALDGEVFVFGGSQPAVFADGNYSASIDETFDTTEVSDFLFEADVSIGGVSILDEELLIENTTVIDFLFGGLSFLQGLDPETVDILGNILAEISDTDGSQREIDDNLFLSFDLTENSSTASSSVGTFNFALTEGPLLLGVESPFILTDPRSLAASFSISTVEVAAVPLPASLPMLAFGAFGLFAMKRRRQVS